MVSTKHRLLFAFIALQLFGAMALMLSFYIEVWILELLVSFTPLFLTVLIVSLGVSSIFIATQKHLRQSTPLLILTGIAWLATIFILFHTFTVQKPIEITETSAETITFAAFNKLYSNYDTKRYTNYLNQQDIDILALQEMRPAEVPAVAETLGFAHSHVSRTFTTSGGTAVALLSRYPFESVETVELATKHPVIRAEIKTPDSDIIVVYSVHVPVPASKYLYTKRNIVLNSLAEAIQQEELPVLVGGDFNTTVFSPAMREFSREVSPSIKPIATEKIPTCSWYGYGSPLCIRIDHIFAPTSAQITNLTISPDIGSDHRAVIAKIAIER